MSFLSYLGTLSQTHMWLYRLLHGGKLVGEDAFGNRYYASGKHPRTGRERRWVAFKDTPEASSVPPEWHAWLHHTIAAPPDEATARYRRDWQKPHQPNPTGTEAAYRPKGHDSVAGPRAKATGDYEAWTPPG